MAATIRLYDDHRSSAEAEGGYPTIYLCDDCAEQRGGNVTFLNDPPVGEELYCEDCSNPNQAAEERELEDAEAYRLEARSVMLQEFGVVSWENISGDFEGADLLLGNGFSLNLSPLFNYDSLFEEFLRGCNPDDAKVFRRFGTTNFERIQEQLLGAKRVNTIFALPTRSIDLAIQKLREGLITSIESNHPRAHDIDDDALLKISEALDTFEDVFTFNYDLFLYRIIMKSVERAEATGIRKHSDYFWNEQSEQFLEFMDFDNYNNRHVYYLHGALFLFSGSHLDYHNDLKLRRGDQSFDELIDIVASKIRVGTFPLFVSEGTPEEKLRAIFDSPYLRFAYGKLGESKRPLVVYGWSISGQDKHILSILNSPWRGKRRLAVSVYAGKKTRAELEQEIAFLKARLSGHSTVFFDSSTLFTF
jgi:Domain of unknown function (DUF4917)